MNAKERIMKRSNTARTFALGAVAAVALAMAPMAKAESKPCSNATLKGVFAQKDVGFITAPPAMAGPFAGVSAVTFDGNGTVTATGMVNVNGTVIPVTQKGVYRVNRDCTGTYEVQISPLGLTGHAFFVIADGGNELQILPTDPGSVITCTARKQFPAGDSRD
jgi:hypothetical protein